MTYSQMRLKQLRGILQEYNAPCRGCVEKAHYIDRIQAVRWK